MRLSFAGSTLLALIGIAALQAQPPTPTRTPTAGKRSPTAPGKVVTRGEAAQSDTGRPGDTNAPVRSDSAGPPRREDTAASAALLADVAAQHDDIERAIEELYQKLVSQTKSDIEDLNAQIAAANEQIRKLREAQEKIKKVAAAMQSYNEQQAAANLSKKIDVLEARAQKLRASLIMRTPVPKTPTPKAKG